MRLRQSERKARKRGEPRTEKESAGRVASTCFRRSLSCSTSPPRHPPRPRLPLFLPQAPPDKVSGLIHAATLLAQLLGQGRALDSRALRSAMETAFGASDAEGAWVWKDAYEALEAAQVLFLRKFGAAMRRARARPPRCSKC